MPVTSLGSRSGVNWMRRVLPPNACAIARASVVFPTPGTSSINTWPPANMAANSSSAVSSLPMTEVRISTRMRPARSATWSSCTVEAEAPNPGMLAAAADTDCMGSSSEAIVSARLVSPGRELAERAVAGRRNSEGGRERPGEVRLIGEAGVEGNVDDAFSACELRFSFIEPPHEQVAVRTGAEQAPELARKFIAAQPGGVFQ